MKNLLLFLILLISTCCHPPPPGCGKTSHYYIVVKNNSVNKIYFHDNANGLQIDNNLTKFKKFTFLDINSQKKIYLPFNSCWDVGYQDNKFEYFYFYDAAALDNNKWEDVVKNNLGILDSIRVDLDYMQKNNWTVTYPK